MGSVTSHAESMLKYFILIAASFLAIFPVYWVIINSFKLPREWMAWPPVFFVTSPTFDNWGWVIWYYTLNPFLNSLIISSCSTGLTLLIGAPAAYGLARFDFKRRNDVAFWILSQRMFPPVAVVFPYFLMYQAVKLMDTHIGLILLYAATNLPFFIWVMREFFLDLPKEIEEAALVDGCSRVSVFIRIVVPLSTSALAAICVFCYIFSWNEFMFASVLTRDVARTLPLQIAQMQATRGIEFGYISCLGTLSVVPVMLLAVAVQRYMVKGLTLGAVKG